MKQLLTLTLVAVLGFAVVGCNKTSKVNASTTAAQCRGANCDPASCAKCPLAGTAECPLGKQAKPAAAGDATSCCASKKAAVKPAATSSKNKADCNPSDCGSWKKGDKGSGSGCPFSGS